MLNIERYSAKDAERLRQAYAESLNTAEKISAVRNRMPEKLDGCSERMLDEWFELSEEFRDKVRLLAEIEVEANGQS